MRAGIRLIVAFGVLAVLAGAGCKDKPKEPADEGGPAAGPTARSPEVLKAFRQSQARAHRRPRDLQAQLEAGKIAFEQGLYNDAYQNYKTAVNVDPHSYDAIEGMARTNLKLLNPAQGLDWVGRARRLKPHDVPLIELEARLHLLAGQMDKAIAGFREATRRQPQEVSTWLNLAAAYAVTRQYGEAVAIARKAVTMAPQSADAHFALGRFSERNGARAEAEREYRTAIRLNAKHTGSLVALARILVADKRKLDEARSLAVRASQVESDRADAAILAAWVLHLQGDDKRAVAELNKVVNAMPQNPEAWEKYAVTLRRVGLNEKAEQAEAFAKQFMPQSNSPEMELLEEKRK